VVEAYCPLLKHLRSVSFCPSLAHIIVHHPSLLMHVCRLYLAPLPPITPSAKFWSLFAPLAERNEGSRIIFGPQGEGTASDEAVLQVVKRDHPKTGKKRFITKTLVGWKDHKTCELSSLEALRDLPVKPANSQPPTVSADPLSFRLNLTGSQQTQRAQVPLPYVHTGYATRISYDPDSADDFDEDDPDEDLDF